MPKNIIVEGYDGGGKTSLADRLRRHFGFSYFHAGPPAKDNNHAIKCCQDQMEVLSRGGHVIDRVTPISRQCYQLELTLSHIQQLNKYLDMMMEHSVVIWCDPKEYIHEPGDHDTEEHLRDIAHREERIKKRYHIIMDSIDHIHYDRFTMTEDELIKLLEER